jgi:hypothetical protein
MKIISNHLRLAKIRQTKLFILDRFGFVERLAQFPALFAFCIQVIALVLVGSVLWASYYAMQHIFGFYVVLPVFVIVLFQAIFASSLAYLFQMASWWRLIHFSFPMMVWGMLIVNLPNEIYLIGFIVTLSIFWTSFRTQVPYYPSRLKVWKKVSAITHEYQAKQLNQNHPIRLIDIGSGLGGFSMHLARAHKNAKVEGVEVAPLPWVVSWLVALVKRSTAQFKLGNYHQLDFAQYDIIFAYLSPAAMDDLWHKSKQEMRQGCLLISLEFPVQGVAVTQHLLGEGESPDIYIYQF